MTYTDQRAGHCPSLPAAYHQDAPRECCAVGTDPPQEETSNHLPPKDPYASANEWHSPCFHYDGAGPAALEKAARRNDTTLCHPYLLSRHTSKEARLLCAQTLSLQNQWVP